MLEKLRSRTLHFSEIKHLRDIAKVKSQQERALRCPFLYLILLEGDIMYKYYYAYKQILQALLYHNC
jgi:hypothetical protein